MQFQNQLHARTVLAAGAPRRAEVKAAANHLYLSRIGKAGGLDIEKAEAIVSQNNDWQDARRYLALPMNTASGRRAAVDGSMKLGRQRSAR